VEARHNDIMPTHKAHRCSPLSILAVGLLFSATGLTQTPKKPTPATVHPDLVIVSSEVVQEQWPNSLSLVNAPTDLQQVEPGQCIRFGVISTGDDRDQLLKSVKFSFELTTGGKTQSFDAEPASVIKQVKPVGGDFVTEALGVAGVENPIPSVASLAVSQTHWCVPADVQDGSATVVARVLLGNGKLFVLNPRTVEVKTFEGARKKPAFTDMKTFAPWLQAYHWAPDPAHLLPGLRIAAAEPDAGSGYSIMSFFIAALTASPAAQDDVAHHLPSESAATRAYAVPLLRLAGYNVDPLLSGFKDENKAKLKSVGVPNPFDISPDRVLPSKMDMLWASFFASGRIEPVRTIASMLAWREDYDKFMKMRESGQKPVELTDSIMRGVVYSAAGWSISILSRNDGVVADYIDALKVSSETPDAVKRELSGLYTNAAFTKK
jgi:hypothetical protein